MVHSLVLGTHVAAGAVGLVAGATALVARKRRGPHPTAGVVYQLSVLGLSTSAVGLALFDPGRLWWLALIGVATQAAALGGWWVARLRFPGWLPWHVRLMCGSYVSFVTGFLVTNWSSPLAWFLPTIVATPLIARATARRSAPPRPREVAA
jgi:hypothetical protein